MSIVDKMAEAMYNATGEFGISEDDTERAAQAAWDVVKADMLGDGTKRHVAIAIATSDAITQKEKHIFTQEASSGVFDSDTEAAIAATIKKLEE